VTWRTTVQVAGPGPRQSAYSDLTFVRAGRTVASLFDFQLGDPFPSGERTRLVGTVAKRMGAF
jgi:hypothetical protein